MDEVPPRVAAARRAPSSRRRWRTWTAPPAAHRAETLETRARTAGPSTAHRTTRPPPPSPGWMLGFAMLAEATRATVATPPPAIETPSAPVPAAPAGEGVADRLAMLGSHRLSAPGGECRHRRPARSVRLRQRTAPGAPPPSGVL